MVGPQPLLGSARIVNHRSCQVSRLDSSWRLALARSVERLVRDVACRVRVSADLSGPIARFLEEGGSVIADHRVGVPSGS